MTSKRSNRTTIIIEPAVRDTLKHIARKDQSYNALLLDLIQLHKDHVEKAVQEGKANQTNPLVNNLGADTTNRSTDDYDK